MRILPPLAGLLGIFVFAGAAAGADTHHPAPAAPSDAAVTQAAIAALAKGPLHDLSVALDKLNERLDALDAEVKRASRSLGDANLPELARREAATRSAAADLSTRQDSLENGLAGAQARVAASAAAASAAIQELKRQQGSADARLGTLQQGSEERLAALAKTLSTQISSDAAARHREAVCIAEMLVRAVGVAAAVLAALIGAAAWLDGRGRLALRREISLTRVCLGGEFRQALAAAAPAPEISAPLSDWRGRESRPVEWGENGAAPGAPNSEKPTLSVGPPAESAVASRLLWPADFLDPESPLSRWRFLLEGHLADDDHPALPVLTHLLGLRALLRDPATAAPAEIAPALFRLSESLHAYWHSLADLSAEDRQQASADWLQGMRALLAGAGARLDLREIMPGARVDPDLMHAVTEGPGNHLNVADVFSWAVIDRAGGRPRVLHRAQIAST